MTNSPNTPGAETRTITIAELNKLLDATHADGIRKGELICGMFGHIDIKPAEIDAQPTPATPAEPTQSDYVFLDEGPDGYSAMGRKGKWVLKDKSSKPAPITAEELDNILEDWQTEDLEDLADLINKRAGL